MIRRHTNTENVDVYLIWRHTDTENVDIRRHTDTKIVDIFGQIFRQIVIINRIRILSKKINNLVTNSKIGTCRIWAIE